MRIPAHLHAVLVAIATAAIACSGNNPQPPEIVQAGWSWTAASGERTVPVLWRGGAAPAPLPLLPGGDCDPSGSAHALAKVNGAPYAVGISLGCAGGTTTMSPVAWHDGTVSRLPPPAGATQGTALAVTTFAGSVYVAGGSGDAAPMPTIWKDGAVGTRDPRALLPVWADAGIITSFAVTEKFAIAAGIVHSTLEGPPFLGVVWVLDPDFTFMNGTLLPPPAAMTGATFSGSVAAAFDGQTLFTVSALSSGGNEKPIVWMDDIALAILGDDFTVGPWGVPFDIRLVELTPYVTGFFRPSGPGTAPQPALWTPVASQLLSTAGGATGVGSGEALGVAFSWAFVGGESLAPDPTDGSRMISVPARWTNGERQDLVPLSAPGGGPLLVKPLPGWWTVPGSAPSEAGNWPYPGGFGEVLAGRPVAAAGSAVARALLTIP
jgi:hypothetical protein